MSYSRANSKVTFTYTNTVMIKDFLEIGNDIVPINSLDNGKALIEDRSRIFPFVDEPDEVSSSMINRLFSTAASILYYEMRDLLPPTSGSSSDISSNITFQILDNSNYTEDELKFLDTYIRNIFLHGALNEWFKTTEAVSVSDYLKSKIDEETVSAKVIIRGLVQKLRRKSVPNPFYTTPPNA